MSSSSTAPSSSVPPSSSSTAPSSSIPPSSSAVSTTSSSASSASASATSASATSASASITSASATSSGAASSSSAASTTQSTFISSVVITVTASNGSTYLSTSATAVSTGVSGGGSSGNNNAPIIGGVVGGVGGLILIAGLLWFCLRKRKNNHRDDFDDMMFDPTRAQNHAQVDLADNSGPTVEPFYAPGVASTAATSPEMAQYPRSAASTSEGGYDPATGISRGPSSASSAGYAGRGAGQYGNMPMPMPTIPDHYASGAAAGAAAGGAAGLGAAGLMNAKQREAYQEHQRFHVANQGYGQPGGSGSMPQDAVSPGATSPSGVTVHTDGGRIPIEDEQPALGSEIPPTYDSIRR